MTDKTELKPCPFCSGINVSLRYIRDGIEAYCQDCDAQMPRYNPESTDKAIEAWNKRST